MQIQTPLGPLPQNFDQSSVSSTEEPGSSRSSGNSRVSISSNSEVEGLFASEIRQEAAVNSDPIGAVKCSGVLKESDLDYIRKRYGFASDLTLRLPAPTERANDRNTTEICLYEHTLIAGFRFPLHDFVPQILKHYQIVPAQLLPNSWRFVFGFIIRSYRVNRRVSLPLFIHCFILNVHQKNRGWFYFSHRSKAKVRILDKNPSSIKKWKDRFFFVSCVSGFPFSTTVWTLKPDLPSANKMQSLDCEDEETLRLMGGQDPVKAWEIGDENFLFKYELTPVDPNADVYMALMAKKSGNKKGKGKAVPPIELQPPQKRPGSGEAVPEVANVVPFVPEWSIKKDDTALGDSKVAKEMVLKGRLPSDVKLVSELNDGALVKSCYNLAAQTSVYIGELCCRMERVSKAYNLEVNVRNKLEGELKIVKNEIVQLTRKRQADKVRSEKAEAEAKAARAHSAEMERLSTELKAQLAKAKTLGIAEYKDSKEFAHDIATGSLGAFKKGCRTIRDYVVANYKNFDAAKMEEDLMITIDSEDERTQTEVGGDHSTFSS